MSKIKNGRLDQYGAEPFEQQQFGTADVEGVKKTTLVHILTGLTNLQINVQQSRKLELKYPISICSVAELLVAIPSTCIREISHALHISSCIS